MTASVHDLAARFLKNLNINNPVSHTQLAELLERAQQAAVQENLLAVVTKLEAEQDKPGNNLADGFKLAKRFLVEKLEATLWLNFDQLEKTALEAKRGWSEGRWFTLEDRQLDMVRLSDREFISRVTPDVVINFIKRLRRIDPVMQKEKLLSYGPKYDPERENLAYNLDQIKNLRNAAKEALAESQDGQVTRWYRHDYLDKYLDPGAALYVSIFAPTVLIGILVRLEWVEKKLKELTDPKPPILAPGMLNSIRTLAERALKKREPGSREWYHPGLLRNVVPQEEAEFMAHVDPWAVEALIQEILRLYAALNTKKE